MTKQSIITDLIETKPCRYGLLSYFKSDSIIGLSASRAEEKIADWQLYTAGRTRIPHPSIPEGEVIAVAPWFAESISEEDL